jgi:mono/diheme cytochrome c family protein
MRFRQIVPSITVLMMASLAASGQPQVELPPPAKHRVDFTAEIHSLLAERCFECHGGGRTKGGFRMDTRELFLRGGESGPVVISGNSAESYLIKLVSGAVADLRMPPKGEPLSPEQVGALRAWIDQGLEWHENSPPEAAAHKPSPKLDPPELPPAGDAAVSNPIDLLLERYFDQHGIAPPEPVPGRVFIRRAFLNTVGLLPKPEEVTAFVEDQSPEKYARLADRLLNDNLAYAEHWMTFWNDHLRNDFQGTGYIDGGRKPITPWLFNALYNNMPYDQFVAQLINPTPESEGFVKGIVWRGVTAAAMVPPMQAAQTVSQVFLGVNLKCASCHDSFIDHWKLADSYGMASVFADGPMELVRCDVPQGETAEIKFLWPELGGIDPARSVEGRRAQLARILISEEDGFFTRSIVNRIWARYLGRGMIEPLDTIENEPWNAELLDWLAADLIDHGYNLKHLMRLILTSRAYRLPSVSTPPNSEHPYVFRGPEVQRMSAEQFLDAVSTVTGAWMESPQFAVPEPPRKKDEPPPPPVVRAWRVNSDPLTRAMGRPNREQVTTRRVSVATPLEAIEMTNGQSLADHLARGAKSLLSGSDWSAPDLFQALYLRSIQRDPTPDEIEIAMSLMGPKLETEGVEDLLWAIAMQPEFQLIY